MEDKSKLNLRNLLFHFKFLYLKNNKEKYEDCERECHENLHDLIKENVEYFANNYAGSTRMFYAIPLSVLEQHKPSEIYELSEKFNVSATGLYGLPYDNQTDLVFTDLYGNPFLLAVYKNTKGYKNSKDCYEFYIYNMNNQGCLYNFSIKTMDDVFAKEHIDALKNMRNYQKAYYDKVEASHKRYEEIKKYSDYITVKYIKTCYAHCIKEVRIKKDIPITLTSDEIAKYADGWNYCFGAVISKSCETDEEDVYRVKIYTD